MARLVRMDQTGHTTLAEWTPGDAAAVEAAAVAFREQLDAGYYAVVSTGEGHAEQVRELPRRRRARDPAAADRRRVSTAPVLPETAAVYWRPRLDAARLRRRELGWTLSTLAHTIPFLAAAVLMLYARAALVPGGGDRARPRLGDPGALRQPRRLRGPARARAPTTGPSGPRSGCWATCSATRRATLHARTGLALERGGLGVWLVGEAGALLVRPGRRGGSTAGA